MLGDLVKTLDSCRGRVLKLPKIQQNRNRSQLRTISVKPQEQKTTFNDSEEFSGRSTSKLDTSKLDSSILFKTRRPRASIRPIQMMSMRTQQTCDITAVVALIQQGPIRTSIKNLRITREQLQLYLCKFYPLTIAESILRIFKAPQLFSYQKYQQWVDKINKLDDEQSIRCVFQIYDFNQQGYITTSTIWDLLSKDYHSQAIEFDIFYLVSNKQVKDQLLRQGDPIIQNEKPNFSLPVSILGSKLKQSLQIQRRFTISPENRPRLQSKTISAGRSIDFTLEDDVTKKELQKLKFKKHQMITQIQIQQITDEDQKSMFIPNSKKEMKRISCIKCSIDINTFTEIWYPQRPQLYEDIIRRLTSTN
ncbi:hypothetical protein pb186bvf_013254 [Paramecium bursaria]